MDYKPDHNQPRFGDFGATPPPARPETTRLSLLAVASLVTGVLALVGCCIPAVGILPAGLGMGSLFVIHRSRGAVAGRGLAIAGLMLGSLSLIVGTGLWIGASSMASKFGPVYGQVLDPDPAVVRTVLAPKPASELTDGQIEAFQQALHAEHPGAVTLPSGLWGLYAGFAQAGDNPNRYQSMRDPTEGAVLPLPVQAGSDWFYLVILMSPDQKIASGFPPVLAVADAGFERADGTMVWLSEVQTPIGEDSQSPPADQTDDRAGTPPPAPEENPGG
jgi:hypothetical protein